LIYNTTGEYETAIDHHEIELRLATLEGGLWQIGYAQLYMGAACRRIAERHDDVCVDDDFGLSWWFCESLLCWSGVWVWMILAHLYLI
jgi:hypothetical protein